MPHDSSPQAPPEAPIRFFPPFPAWTGIDVIGIGLITALALIVCLGVAIVITSMLPGWQHAKAGELARLTMVGIAAQSTAYIIMFFYIARVLRQRSGEPALVAIQWNSRLGTVVMGIVGGLVLATLVQLVALRLPVPRGLPVETLFQTPSVAYVTAVFSVLFAPLFEEVYFRGLMFPSLREHMHEWAAIILTAIAFALLHAVQLGFSWAALVPMLMVGMVLTWVRAQLRSVAASWTMHVTYNLTIVVGLWVSTGHFRHLG